MEQAEQDDKKKDQYKQEMLMWGFQTTNSLACKTGVDHVTCLVIFSHTLIDFIIKFVS